MIDNINISKGIMMSVTIMIMLVLISSLIQSHYNENNAFAAQVKSRHLTPFQSGFIDGFAIGQHGDYNNLGAYHTKAYYSGYESGHYVGCMYHNSKPSNPSNTINCGDKPAINYRSDSYLTGYVDQNEGITSVLLNNVNDHSSIMKDYRAGYNDAANPCYDKDCHS